MEYAIENEYLIVTVTTWGAQVKSVVRKFDDVEHMWQADKSVWGYHAPILFPHTGKVVDDLIETKGEVYQAKQHGFARLMEHTLVRQTEDTIVMELRSSEETLRIFPYAFRLVSTFTLDGDEKAIAEAKEVLAKKGATYQNVYFASDGEAGKFTTNIFAYPTTYVVDRNGNIVGDPIVGAVTEKNQAEALQAQISKALSADMG